MNILHLQFDTEIRTLYEVNVLKNKNNEIKIYLAYTGESYTQKFGCGEELFSGVYKLPYVCQKDIFYLSNSIQFNNLLNDLKQIIIENKIDIIHVHKRTDIQCFAALQTGLPFVIDAHDLVCVLEDSIRGTSSHWSFKIPIIGIAFSKLFYKRLTSLEKYCMENASNIIAVSPIMKQKIEDKYNVCPNKIDILPNTVSLQHCSSEPKSCPSVPIKALLATSFFLDKKSRSHRYITPFLDIIKYNNDIKIDLYGWTNITKNDVDLFLKSYHNVTYKGFLVPNKYVRMINNYDVGIIFNNPYYDVNIGEMSLPKKLFEYAAKGLPILAFGTDQIKIFVEHYNIGATFNELSIESFNGALYKVRENYGMYSENAINMVRVLYNWDKQIEQLEEIYRLLTEK